MLVDCGFPCGNRKRLLRLGVNPAQLSAILVTHEHADHVHGVGLLSRRYNLPVYLSRGTLRGMRKPIEPTGFLAGGEQLRIGALDIEVIAVAHDAQEPTQYVFSDREQRRFGLLTDLGSYCERVLEGYRDLDALMIESNHCRTCWRAVITRTFSSSGWAVSWDI